MLAIILLGVVLVTPAEPQLPAGASCDQIRALVAEHGKAKALAWAIRNGYSWTDIREARKCLTRKD